MSSVSYTRCDLCSNTDESTWMGPGWAKVRATVRSKQPIGSEDAELDVCPECWAKADRHAINSTLDKLRSESKSEIRKRRKQWEDDFQANFEAAAKRAGIELPKGGN